MAQQNIYDNEIFFEGYKKIRDNEVNANNLFEIPALFSMMPDLTGKRFWIWDAVSVNIVNDLLNAVLRKLLVWTYQRKCWKWLRFRIVTRE